MDLRKGWNELGFSVEGRSIRACANFNAAEAGSENWTLFLGGTHGDETATVPFLETFITSHLQTDGGDAPALGPLAVLPLLNPDGYARDSRYNARGVDLNRNLPMRWSSAADEPSGSAPLSEPETQVLFDLVTHLRPARIVSLHWALSEIDADGAQAEQLARGMWSRLQGDQRRLFRLRVGEGRSRAGSLGSFCSGEQTPALVTLELPYHSDPDLHDAADLPDDHLETVRQQWRGARENYWRAVYPAVESMLLFAAGERGF